MPGQFRIVLFFERELGALDGTQAYAGVWPFSRAYPPLGQRPKNKPAWGKARNERRPR